MSVLDVIYRVSTNITVKLNQYISNYETDESLANYQKYLNVFMRTDSTVSEDERDTIIAGYNEMNAYCRMLLGLPDLKDDGILIIEEDLKGLNIGYDLTKPLHEQTESVKSLLYINRLTESLYDKYKMKYILNIGKGIKKDSVRLDPDYSIIHSDYRGLSSSDKVIFDKYQEIYEINRKNFVIGCYNEYYANFYRFYDDLISRILIFAAVGLTIAHYSGGVLDYDSLSETDLLKIMASNGLPEWKMPRIILKEVAVSLNSLLNNKGSKRTIMDILNIFGSKNLYRYYIQKVINKETITTVDKGKDKYKLKMFRVPFGSKDIYKYSVLPEYDVDVNSFFERNTYDSQQIEEINEQLFQSSFSTIPTNFMTIENINEVTKASYDISKVFATVFNCGATKDMTFMLNVIDDSVSLFDIFVYLISLSYYMIGVVDRIMYRTGAVTYVLGVTNSDISSDLESALRVALSTTLNPGSVNNKLINEFNALSSTTSITTFIDQFVDNCELVDMLTEALHKQTDYRKYRAIEIVLDSISIIGINKDIYNNKDTYKEYLMDSNTKLYSRLNDIINTNDKDDIANEILSTVDVIETLFAIDGDTLKEKHLSGIRSLSDDQLAYLKDFLYDVINFFKSHTNRFESLDDVQQIQDKNDNIQLLEDAISSANIRSYDVGEYRYEFTKDELVDVTHDPTYYGERIDTVSIEDVLIEINYKKFRGGSESYD